MTVWALCCLIRYVPRYFMWAARYWLRLKDKDKRKERKQNERNKTRLLHSPTYNTHISPKYPTPHPASSRWLSPSLALLFTHTSHAQTLRKTPKRYKLSTHPHPPKPPSETSSQVVIGSSEMEHPRPLQRGYSWWQMRMILINRCWEEEMRNC